MDSAALDNLDHVRIYNLENGLKQITEATYDMNKNISSLVAQIGSIQQNLERMIDVSTRLTERIHLLENDLNERTIRKKVYKSLIAFYPLIIIAFMLFSNIDHRKMLDLLKQIQLLLPKLG